MVITFVPVLLAGFSKGAADAGAVAVAQAVACTAAVLHLAALLRLTAGAASG